MRLGRYELFARLGSGGMADVFLARSAGPLGFAKLVVIKQLRAAKGLLLEMFLDEARLAARLRHPNIVDTYDVGECDGAYFIAMEYLDGQSLSKVLRKQRRAHLSLAHKLRIATETLRGLSYAHGLEDYDGAPLGIVHRDVSPQNLFITYSGSVKIVDFGVAKATVNAETDTGVLKGKFGYMAPEQMRGEHVDRRADVFSAGVVLWELLTGRRLFQGEIPDVMRRVLNDEILPVSTFVQNESMLDDIVAKSVAREPSDRYQSADEMREAIEQYARATGLPMLSDDDLGTVVRPMFEVVRANMVRQIQAHMTSACSDEASGSLPRIENLVLTSDPRTVPTSVSVDAAAAAGHSAPEAAMPGSLAPQALPSTPPVRREAAMLGLTARQLLLAAAAGVTLLLTGLTGFAIGGSRANATGPAATIATVVVSAPVAPPGPLLPPVEARTIAATSVASSASSAPGSAPATPVPFGDPPRAGAPLVDVQAEPAPLPRQLLGPAPQQPVPKAMSLRERAISDRK